MPRISLLAALPLLAATVLAAQPPAARTHALTSTDGLTLHNVTARVVTHAGHRAVRITGVPEAQALQPMREQLAILDGPAFGDGVIEVELAGAPAADAPATARGFVGIAFRVQPDFRTYDAFYLRPTNGRADDQVRRNHASQYISHPDWPWDRLRQQFPKRYEAYVDLVPDAWTRVRIEVRGDRARLFVHGQEQPTLVVNDVKSGAGARGAIALWIDVGTVAHFRNLRISP